MALYDLANGALQEISPTSFAAQGVLERTHLQAAIKQRVDILGDDLLVIAEEYGDFAEANRRIDLLCVDRQARLVVVELKRTADGGHMELQALRYAAMVSTMTFEDVVSVYQRHLEADDDARSALIEWFTETDEEEPVIQRDVRIVLVAAGFDKQITTTALWLADVYGLDLRCVKVTPYRIDDRLILDVQQLIPLAEAEDFLIQVRRRETLVRVATTAEGRDWTPYVVRTPTSTSKPLRKRRAILAMVEALREAGVPAAAMKPVLGRRFLAVDGDDLSGDELVSAFVGTYPKAQNSVRRWFIKNPIYDDGRTWLLSNQWGTDSESILTGLAALDPSGGITFEPA